MKTTIAEVNKYIGQEVTIGCWLANKRSSGKIAFLQLRDGSGFIQGVVVKEEVDEEIFQQAKSLTQETSLYITGVVQEDSRSPFGYELLVKKMESFMKRLIFQLHRKSMGQNF